MGSLDGKTALVTGGTSGIGLAAAHRLAAEGAHVFITGRTQSRVDEAARQIGGGVTGVASDVTVAADLDRLADAIRERGAGLDVLFANAGGGEFATLEEETPQRLTDTFNRNVGGTVFTVQKMLPLLNEGASVILAGSTAATRGTPAFGAYAASKAAVRSFGRTWAAELAGRSIRVNTLVPGPVETPGLTELAPPGQEQELLDAQAASLPMHRVGRPSELANVVAFLASDASSFMTGSEVFVDGGANQV
ncbi:SDR family NAD(P)-dependent oxidoreductase [Mycolicibacterium grossiae]|uniref:Short-chain dehydrogenase n=1 Tax=Mycolicibacterium grossiae TaxID=1552759 RepID=A0A1E8Q8Y3_9MYCO|nr:SDR family oxidoreductase [Mycolicibacterium grossiae]OFJ55083.1 short-chain dehydrogenase [Mycolicibacterium grossiae]QEM47858.1 SDR family oxidoreductase [Mycolicibacterium grossiae]